MCLAVLGRLGIIELDMNRLDAEINAFKKKTDFKGTNTGSSH